MSILVIADHNNQTLNGATLNVVAAAQKIGGDITVLVAGSGAQAVADAAAKVAGVSKVLLADNAAYANQLAENVAALVADLAKGYKYVLAASTTTGKNILPRVAALLDVSMIDHLASRNQSEYMVFGIYNFTGALKGFSVSNFFGIQTSPRYEKDFLQNRFTLSYKF